MKMNYKGLNVEIKDELIQELKQLTGEDAVESIKKVIDNEPFKEAKKEIRDDYTE